MHLLAFRCTQQKEINLKISQLCPSVITSVSNHSPSFTYEEVDMWRGKFSHYQMVPKSGWSYWFAIALTLMCQVSPLGEGVREQLRGCRAEHLSSPTLCGKDAFSLALPLTCLFQVLCAHICAGITQAIPPGQLAVPIIFKGILCSAQFCLLCSAQGSPDTS